MALLLSACFFSIFHLLSVAKSSSLLLQRPRRRRRRRRRLELKPIYSHSRIRSADCFFLGAAAAAAAVSLGFYIQQYCSSSSKREKANSVLAFGHLHDDGHPSIHLSFLFFGFFSSSIRSSSSSFPSFRLMSRPFCSTFHSFWLSFSSSLVGFCV